jgi:serine O-acetyltransferase
MNKSDTCCIGEKRHYAANSAPSYVMRVLRAIARIVFFIHDAVAILKRDPAINRKALGFLEVPLYASFWALLLYRLAHPLNELGIPFFPRLLSQVARFLTGIEIHPGAVLGPGLFIDHGMGVVIGETAIVGRNVTLFHGVTLGGVDGRPGRRHPCLGDGVVVGAGAKILGALSIGDHVTIGAQAVVLSDIPRGSTAVGVPARLIGRSLVS